jgi:hypothetical protein
MYNAATYLLEKQAHRRTTPLSQTEMLRLYGQTKGGAPTWGARLGSALSAVTKGITARALNAPAQPILETK